jgi:hypothetical protein
VGVQRWRRRAGPAAALRDGRGVGAQDGCYRGATSVGPTRRPLAVSSISDNLIILLGDYC